MTGFPAYAGMTDWNAGMTQGERGGITDGVLGVTEWVLE